MPELLPMLLYCMLVLAPWKLCSKPQFSRAKKMNVYLSLEARPIESESQEPSIPLPSMFEGDNNRSWSPTYDDYATVRFIAPIIPTYMMAHDPDEHNRLRAEVEQMISQSEPSDEEENIPDCSSDLDDEENEIDDDMAYTNVPVDSAYSLYPNKVNMLLDMIDNLPQLRMSNSERVQCFKCPIVARCRTTSKSIVVVNRNLTHPVNNWTYFRVWQAQHWKEFKPSELTPMYACGLCQFYIDEVAELESGALTGRTIGVDIHAVPASEFCYNYQDVIERIGDKITWADTVKAPEMPAALGTLAEGNDLYVVMVPIWAADVSGNKSK
ncbi:hypothetical protein B0H10DRAFT_1964004 [Mycena sp. CBHHK59/15]|nr:hypothetical protein B0H10DRAFT_1964004 [Mycena sp. CBHHK59/15]